MSYIIFFLLASHCIAQPILTLKKTLHDFGRIANLNYPPAVFEFTNTGNEQLAILMVKKSTNIKVGYPRKYIQPGETGKILVLPDFNKLGVFTETITIVSDAKLQEVPIIIKGEVITVQACFPNPNDWNIRKILVLDKATKMPVAAAKLDLLHNMANKISGITDKKGEWTGKMPIGQYSFNISAPKYNSLNKDQFVNKSLPLLIFELEMPPPPLPETELYTDSVKIIIPQEEIILAEENSLLPTKLYAANNIVLLLDVSLSMRDENKLGLLKESVFNLVYHLRQIDNVSLIVYSGLPKVIFESVPGSDKLTINTKVNALTANGITNGVKGLESAYSIALKKFLLQGNNQIILATDGKFTGGSQQPASLKKMITENANNGIILSIIGFGVDTDAKTFMADMAKLGKGTYIHINSKDDVSNVLINEVKEKSIIKK
jgi:hypothetical protein